MQTASVYAPILKKERQSDGTLLVTGIASDDTLDIDEQIADPDWLARAMPAWFEYGNIREQHSNIAAGVATKLETKGSAHIVTARVVDPNSVNKVELNVLKGFSIGIRNPRITHDKAAPGGRIVDGEIVEVSLVDRPANPSCLIELAKTVGGAVTQVETLIEKEGALMERCANCGKACKADDLDAAKMCKECKAAMESSETSEATGEQSVGDEASGAPETEGEEDGGALAAEASGEGSVPAEESSQKPGEESSQKPGEESSRPGGVAGVAGKEGSEEVSGEGSGEVSLEEHESAEMQAIAGIMEALARIEALLTDSGKAMESTEEVSKSVKAIDERLSKVEKSASRGPVRTVVKAAPAPGEDKAVKAAEYRAKAAATSDPALANGYLLLAAEAESTNN